MKFCFLILFPVLVCISTAHAQCTWYTKICSESTGYHSLAIKTDSTLWAWGLNDNGQLGDGSLVNSANPIQIGNLCLVEE
jgi:alpha-tubulin suppressor-like RCC1 family protein